MTIKVRPGAVAWSDGHPFTARDVAFTYNMLIENGQRSSCRLIRMTRNSG